MESNSTICFQDLWGTAMGYFPTRNHQVMEKYIQGSVKYLKLGLAHFKEYSESSEKSMEDKEGVEEHILKYVLKSAKLLNVDCFLMKDIIEKYVESYFHGSNDQLKEMLTNVEKKALPVLLSEVSDHFFIERLFLLRSIACIFNHFQDKAHPHQKAFAEVLGNMPDVISTLLTQLEESFKEKAVSTSTRGPYCTEKMMIKFSLQRVKEQCEIMELILLYYSHFGMPSTVLLRISKLFKEHEFGLNHPLIEVGVADLLNPLLSCSTALQQVIMIEGLDMELLQESDAIDEHRLIKNKDIFNQIDEVMKSFVNQPELSPLVLSWATVRYLLMPDRGGNLTQKLGDRAIADKVWRHMAQLLAVYPFNTDSKAALAAKGVLLELFSCVTRTFHEDSLGDYSDLVSIATLLLGNTPKLGIQGISNNGLDMLLSSAAGVFPLNIDPLLNILVCMVKKHLDCLQVHAFVSNLPVFAEYLTTCTRDEVESLEDASMWRLLASKPIRTAGGMHTVRLPVGTVGHLVDSQYGEIIQWQHSINGWKVLEAEIKSILEYRGSSSDLELLGYFKKSQLILQLVENILVSMETGSNDNTGCMAVLETMQPFVARIYEILQKMIQTPSPPIRLIETCIRCATAWIKIKIVPTTSKLVSAFTQIQYFPSENQMSFVATGTAHNMHPGIYGALLTECEKINGCFHITVATIDFVITLLEQSLNHDKPFPSFLPITVKFLLVEVFGYYQQWQKSDVESWEKIGVRCLEMCQIILCSSSTFDEAATSPADQQLRKMVVNILSRSNVANVLLNLACVKSETLHALIANEPFSTVTMRVSRTIQLSFSLLNNLLRIESSISPSDEFETGSYLPEILATSDISDNNFISIVAGYLYHRHGIALPCLAVTLLRRISLAAPMSLNTCLGSNAEAIRDVLRARLQSNTEDESLKIGILELFVVSVQTQPGLLELLLHLEPVDKEKPELGVTLGKSSCVSVVLEMIAPLNQGEESLSPRLHTACVKLLNALWVDRRLAALQALRKASTNKAIGFWSSLLYPLFSENSPKDIAVHELLETCAHVFNIIAFEHFYKNGHLPDDSLVKVMDEFADKKRYQHWSKVLLCVSKTLLTSSQFERKSHHMFTSAWKSFLSTMKLTDTKLVKIIMNDLMDCIVVLVNDLDPSLDVKILLDLMSSLMLTLVYRQTKSPNKSVNIVNFLPKVVHCLQKVFESSPRYENVSIHLHAVALHIIKHSSKEDDTSVTSDLIQVTCQHLKYLFREVDAVANIELSILLVRTLEALFVVDGIINPSWKRSVLHESSITLLMATLVRNLALCQDTPGPALRLSITILQLFTTIATHDDTSRFIQQTGLISEFCLNLTNAYRCNSSKPNKNWLEVYHLSIVLITRMIGSLSFDFIDDTLDFIGVHQDRIFQCLSALRFNQNPSFLREVTYTTALLAALSRKFVHVWKFKLRALFEMALSRAMIICQNCVSMLLHPRLLQERAKIRERKDDIHKIKPTLSLSARQSSLPKSQEDDDNLSPEVLIVQQSLVSILGNSLDFLNNLSPNICQITFDQEIDAGEYMQLLTINFGSPSIDQETEASFGTIINAANFALSTLHKIEGNDRYQASYFDSLAYVADSSLILVMSQCLLLLKQTQTSHRSKQLLRRELADELNSCVRNACRHLRHSSSSYSPQSSPIQPLQTSSTRPPATGKGILDLVGAFVKQIMP